MTLLDAPPSAHLPETAPPRRSQWRAARQLAHVEARRLATHPLLLVVIPLGLALTVLEMADFRFAVSRESISLQMVALPLGAVALILTHLATTRPRRDDVVEVLEPVVQGDDTRILALLVAALTPAVMTAAALGAVLAVMGVLGAPGPVLWAEALTIPVVVAAAGLLGVCTGRLAPWRVTPLFALMAVFLVQFMLSDYQPDVNSTREFLAPLILPGTAMPDPTGLLRPALPHLVYVAAIGTAFGIVALVVTRATAVRLTALVTVLAVGVAAGVWQMSPPSDAEVEALLARVGTPAEAGECVDDGTGAQVCAPELFLSWRDDLVEMAHGVRGPLVDRGVDVGPLTVAQRTDPSAASFELARWYELPEVDTAGLVERAWEVEYTAEPGTVLTTSTWHRRSGSSDPSALDVAIRVAQNATGMPDGFLAREEHPDGWVEGLRACTGAGQAREVVTLWLAAQTSPAAAGTLRDALAETPFPATADSGVATRTASGGASLAIDLSTWTAPALPPIWSPVGADVALQLLAQPHDAVFDQLAGDWARWTDPSTSLGELVETFGLTMPPLADDLPDIASMDGAPYASQLLRDTPEPLPTFSEDGLVHYDGPDGYTAGDIGCP